jgi:leucine-rich repeat/coiled-coil domain-containing protein 1
MCSSVHACSSSCVGPHVPPHAPLRRRYVETEVARVKELFDQKEGRLRGERDAAQRQLAEASAHLDELQEQVRELRAQLSAARDQADQQRAAAGAAIKRAAAAEAAAGAAEADASAQAARASEVEQEMSELLAVVEAQKAASAAKMRQLATLLHDM